MFKTVYFNAVAALCLWASPHALAGNACGLAGGNPVLFTTSVPIPESFGRRLDAFGNHLGSVRAAGRGGDLYIRYPDGSLRNLTQEAGFGIALANGDEDPANSIAVRDPAPHWSGTKALFSMVVGAPSKIWDSPSAYWQLYEVEGLCPGQTVKISKLAQPAEFNHLQPVYGSNDQIFFTSDMPPGGAAARHLYPLLDEYETNPIVSGIWQLNRASGQASLLNHTPSGAFNPTVDSAGRLIFSRWDHLKRGMAPPALSGGDACGNEAASAPIFDYASEAANASTGCPGTLFDEVFPELQPNVMSRLMQLGRLPADYTQHFASNQFNQFFPWMMNQDGSGEETLNHVGRHELNGAYLDPSRPDDANLSYDVTRFARDKTTATLADIAGLHQLRESPRWPGRFYAVVAHEIGARAAGQLVSLEGGPKVNAADMQLSYLTPKETRYPLAPGKTAPALMSGLYRQPLPLEDGRLVAVHIPPVGWPADVDQFDQPVAQSAWQMRLRWMKKGADGWMLPSGYLTPGISKSVRYWYSGGFQRSYSGLLWELDPVELRASTPPAFTQAQLPAVERKLVQQQGVDLAALQAWLKARKLALVVVRNVTQRDGSDEQQPYNLRVPGGTASIAPDCVEASGCKVYDVDTLQLFEARYLRSKSWSYKGSSNFQPSQPEGRRAVAHPLESAGPLSQVQPSLSNPAKLKGKLAGSLKVFPDGSAAGFVPAQRALSWQLVDSKQPGQPKFGTDAVVRERYWLSFQAGEVRACASCHGVNKTDQLGRPEDKHPPQALKVLLQEWKKIAGSP
jgi:hypothetical protein